MGQLKGLRKYLYFKKGSPIEKIVSAEINIQNLKERLLTTPRVLKDLVLLEHFH